MNIRFCKPFNYHGHDNSTMVCNEKNNIEMAGIKAEIIYKCSITQYTKMLSEFLNQCYSIDQN